MSRTIQRVACSKCRRPNDPWRTFCGACGSELVGTCKICNAVNLASDKFCGGCARSLLAAPPPRIRVLPPPPIPKAVTHTIQIVRFDDSIVAEVERG